MGFSRQEHRSGLPFPSIKATIERKKVKSLSRVQLFVTPWTVAYQTPPSMEFPRQEYWSGLPCPSPWDLLIQHLFCPFFPTRKQFFLYCCSGVWGALLSADGRISLKAAPLEISNYILFGDSSFGGLCICHSALFPLCRELVVPTCCLE